MLSIKPMPQEWQQYCLSLLFLVVVPLAAIVADLLIKGEVPDQDLYLTLAVYLVAAGASSRSPLFLGVSIVLSGAYFVAYGIVVAQPDVCPHVSQSHSFAQNFSRYALPAIFTAFSASERYKRHVTGAEKFWDFA